MELAIFSERRVGFVSKKKIKNCEPVVFDLKYQLLMFQQSGSKIFLMPTKKSDSIIHELVQSRIIFSRLDIISTLRLRMMMMASLTSDDAIVQQLCWPATNKNTTENICSVLHSIVPALCTTRNYARLARVSTEGITYPLFSSCRSSFFL